MYKLEGLEFVLVAVLASRPAPGRGIAARGILAEEHTAGAAQHGVPWIIGKAEDGGEKVLAAWVGADVVRAMQRTEELLREICGRRCYRRST